MGVKSRLRAQGVDHVILTISNVKRSRAFYQDVLGVTTETFEDGFLFRVNSTTIFCFPARAPIAGDVFDERRIGLDHLSFRAPDQAALEALADRLRAAGSESKGVETFGPTGALYVAFRDPDNIQLEYWLRPTAST